MFKNKILSFIVFASFAFVWFTFPLLTAKASTTDQTLPDNVKITSNPDGSTYFVINSKPGFTTSVKSNCVNGKCTNSATSQALTSADIKKIQDNIKKQQEYWQNFWQMQNDFFAQQQKMFQDFWGMSFF